MKCDCCERVAVSVLARLDLPKLKDWNVSGRCCNQCDVRENEDSWTVWCLVHKKVLYQNGE